MKRLLSVAGYSALLTLLRMCIGFLIAKVVAIYTGPTGMAMLGQVQNGVGLLNGLANSSCSTCVVRYTAENKAEGYEHCSPWWKASLWCTIGILLLVVPFGILMSSEISNFLFDSDRYYWLFVIACLALPFAAIGSFVTSIVNGLEEYKRYIFLGMISMIISAIVTVCLIVTMELNGALIAAAMNSGISGFVVILIVFREPWFKLTNFIGSTDREHCKKVGGYILMAITSAVMVPTSMILFRNVLVAKVGWDLAGQWQAVWKISEVYLSVVTVSLSTYYLPKLSSLSSLVEIKIEIQKTMAIILPVIIVLASSIYLLRDFLVMFLFTEEFSNASELFLIQLAGDVIKVIAWLYAFPMITRGATKWFVFSEIAFAITFVVLGSLLINIYGVHGANYAYLANCTLYLIFVFLNFNRFAK